MNPETGCNGFEAMARLSNQRQGIRKTERNDVSIPLFKDFCLPDFS
jgi:hypothetical protein